ncbi:nuclear transport factor 2 family protein [Amycolatopsis circi]|uniref:nuclear transport factor 2 family protein n=1 Tax=Amycolatopsis circi TaxID=871959 RepID=UPI000E283454|nr:nuclear transport factor 2 family protein [Amycolatopsis circi]
MIGAEDHREIERLVHLYGYYLDDGRFDDLGRLFADTDLYVGDALVARRDPVAVTALWRRYVRIHANGTPRTHHLSTNLVVEDDGPGRARAHSYILVVQHAASFPLQPIIAGDYLDRFTKTDAGWRFAERRIGNDLFGDLSEHLLEPMEIGDSNRLQSWERL